MIRSATAPLLANSFDGNDANRDENVRLMQCLTLGETLDLYQAYKSFANALQAKPGAHLLDAGCGLGGTCLQLAAGAGAAGRVVGLDPSNARLGLARERAKTEFGANAAPVEWVTGDVARLPFAGQTFDGVRIERTLQHVEDPAQAVGEMMRVLRPGGTLVAVEPVWELFSIGGTDSDGDVTKKMCQYWYRSFKSPHVGGQLEHLCAAAGLTVMTTRDFTLDDDNSFRLANALFDLERTTRSAIHDKIVPEKEAQAWLDSLRTADCCGQLRWTLILRLVCATKRAGSKDRAPGRLGG